MKSILRLLPLASLLLIFSSCARQTTPISRTGFYFDTMIRITLYDTHDESLLEGCFALAETYENMLSRTREGSDIWKLNHARGNPVEVQADTLTLLRAALDYAELTEGRVDPTIASVSALWDFSDPDAGGLPPSGQLQEALTHVDYRRVRILDRTVTLEDPAAAIDLGFIAKGFIADRLRDYLTAREVGSAVINLGGNVLTIGTKPDGSPFQVGIQKPFAPEGTAALILPAADLSLVSSGIYERYFEAGGSIYHHILDTKTGYPVRNSLSAVTILSRSSMEGDALSTACFILGLDEGMALIESLEDTEAVFLTSDGSIHLTSGVTLPGQG
ncbi:MAG: FAD:protein FMN transferase [Lachnospiraceae bacterium]|nr:FAD:protein FMN transferase [Lachnospiraceae bacterium]